MMKRKSSISFVLIAVLLGIGVPNLFPSMNRGEFYISAILFVILWQILANLKKKTPFKTPIDKPLEKNNFKEDKS